jgi:hypothetical protein
MASFGYHLTIDVAAPPASVWSVIADYTRDPEWRAGVRMTVEPPGLVRNGSVTTEDLRMLGSWHRTKARICEVEPGRRHPHDRTGRRGDPADRRHPRRGPSGDVAPRSPARLAVPPARAR